MIIKGFFLTISSTMPVHISYLESYWLVLNIFHFTKGVYLFSVHLVQGKIALESLSLEMDKCFEKMKF